jgi:hypothetical protein
LASSFQGFASTAAAVVDVIGAAADTIVGRVDATAAAEVAVDLRVLRPRLAAGCAGRRTEFGSGRTLQRSLFPIEAPAA